MSLDPSGRYRPVRTSLWASFAALSPSARLLYLALLTGSQSNLAGIAFLSRETLSRETALDQAAELESALVELEKAPSPGRSFIVRDDLVIWVRSALEDAPGVFHVVGNRRRFVNNRHRLGVKAILGSLPGDSVVVEKFKRHHRLALQAPTDTPTQGASHTLTKVRRADTEIRNGEQKTETERESREGEPIHFLSSPSQPGSSSPSTNDKGKALLAYKQSLKAERPDITTSELNRLMEAEMDRLRRA